MWILKNSTSLLSSLEKLDVTYAKSVQTFDFSTLCTSISHNLLESRISILIRNSFQKQYGSIRYTYIKVDGRRGYFRSSADSGGNKTCNANQICHMVEFLIDNIIVKFGRYLFRQVIGIPRGTSCTDLFLYSYESHVLGNMIRSGHRKLARSFNLCFRYIDYLIVFINKKFWEYVKDIYVEKTNQSDNLPSYLDLTFTIGKDGKLSTKLYDKRDGFDFYIVNFPFLSSNITLWGISNRNYGLCPIPIPSDTKISQSLPKRINKENLNHKTSREFV